IPGLLCLLVTEVNVPQRGGWAAAEFPQEGKGVVGSSRSFQDEQDLIAARNGREFLRSVNGDILEGKGLRFRDAAQDDLQRRSVQRADARDHLAPLVETQVEERDARFIAGAQFVAAVLDAL